MGRFGPPRLGPGGRRINDLANVDPHLWVHDKLTGEMLAEIPLPQNATGSPITMGRLLRSIGLSRQKARPSHPQKDPASQEAFKKSPPTSEKTSAYA